MATGLLPQSVQNLASSQQDLEATRSVPNGFYTSLHSREMGGGRDAKTKGDELPVILHTHIFRRRHSHITCCNAAVKP